MEKKEIERRLGRAIPDGLFVEALGYAERKQECIYSQGNNPLVMQPWYLAELVAEYARSLIFSEATLKICREIRNMEKERPVKNRNAQMDNHIIKVSAV